MELGLFLSPGSYPDKPLADVVDWYANVVKKAEDLGYSEVWMASHTCSKWARIAAPRQFIARVLALTSKIKLGTAVEVLYQNNPVALAAALAELDQISRGRLMFGFGAGGPLADVHVYGVPGENIGEKLATSNDMLVEAIDVIMNCWQAGGPRDFDGKFWRVRRPPQFDDPKKEGGDFAWHLLPYSPPEPRIAFAGFSAQSTTLRVAGARDYIPLSWSVSKEFSDIQWKVLNEGAATTGKKPQRNRWRMVQVIYVAENAKEARKAIVDGFAADFWRAYWEPIFTRTGVMEFYQKRLGMSHSPSVADMVDSGLWMVGTPDSVTKQLREQIEWSGGFGTLLQTGLDYSGEGAAGWMRSMELLAKEVMPQFAEMKQAA
jgi:alkanesulfonate monooxygenase SsuD/methylene tetrahydromethanopterin reductase-like flavin-dependent oxidoreductase (luciferase family)